ncbi:protein tyrosine phosphatase [Rahnella perminowiae]|uniref:arsenate reductase/protein-tyrosine-phosphatase family protein n=2 Tax=Rahnella perminowiae TaxID=2816244 RepID=UPI00224B85B7|nr:protein tyrosine phosphatase [Rahnella perminowiae]MCX2942658.1 protein tyrosine phosphatase [Rahnella perminowiae]
MFNSVLIVCVGNICRSPIAEALLKQWLPEKNIQSAGLFALKGKGADPMAKTVACRHGISLENHKARQFTREMGRTFDLILVMEKRHINIITHYLPEIRGKIMLLGHWNQRKDIPDPYGGDITTFNFIFSLINESVSGWKAALDDQGLK